MFEYTTVNVLTLLSIVFAVGMMLVSVTRFVTHSVQTLAQLSATVYTAPAIWPDNATADARIAEILA